MSIAGLPIRFLWGTEGDEGQGVVGFRRYFGKRTEVYLGWHYGIFFWILLWNGIEDIIMTVAHILFTELLFGYSYELVNAQKTT